MDKTKITHVNDGFIFLGHRIIPQTQSLWLRCRVVLNDPAGRKQKLRRIADMHCYQATTSESKVDMAEQLNRKTERLGHVLSVR